MKRTLRDIPRRRFGHEKDQNGCDGGKGGGDGCDGAPVAEGAHDEHEEDTCVVGGASRSHVFSPHHSCSSRATQISIPKLRELAPARNSGITQPWNQTFC